jgi:hypothetical protein
MARMKTSRLTKMTTTPQGPGKPAPKKESSNAADWNKYESYVKAKGAYDKDKTEYDARWKRSNEMSGGSISPYNFEAGPAEVKAPELTGKMPIKKASVSTSGKFKTPAAKEKSSEGWFGDYVPSTKGTSNKQLKQFASYASKTGLSESFVGKSKAEIGQYKDEMKSQRKSYAKEGNLAGVKATTADIRQSRNAAKFVGSKNPMDVPGMVKGYQRSEDNAANRNTIKSQVDRLKKLR